MNLRWRLTLLVGALNAMFLVGLTWLLVDNHRSSIREELEATHRITVQMLTSSAQLSRMFGPVPAVMGGYLQDLGHVRGSEIRLYSDDEELRYVSPSSTYKPGRRAPAWFEDLMRPAMEATVLRLPGARIEILPDASKAILDAWDTIVVVEMLGLGLVVVMTGALLFLLRHLLRPTEDDARRLVATTQELAENRVVTRLIQAGIEDERKRVARELHDEMGQSITAIRLIAATLARTTERSMVEGNAARINEIAASLYDGVHRIVRELRPTALEQQDLAAALHDFVREWQIRQPKKNFGLVIDGDLANLDEAVTLAVFRCIQEAVTNALKHAAAGRIDIHVSLQDDILQASIVDDGAPVEDQDRPGSGSGLVGMRERICAVGGEFDAGRIPEGGFRVALRIPIRQDIR
jgi:two-component system, NarL family, sensor histidine kinase UhpB